MTYLATASICELDDLCVWNPFFFSIAFLHLENPFFVKAGCASDEVCIPLSVKCFQASIRATSRISSLVMMQPLKSFKPICSLKWSFCWILIITPESLWNSSSGMNNLIRLQRLDLESWVVSLPFPVCQLLLSMAPNHFHFRVVLWFGLFLRLNQALCH